MFRLRQLVGRRTEKKFTLDPALNKEMNLFISGYKKAVGDLKQEGVMTCFEGKRPLSFEVYKMLAGLLFQLTP